MHIWVQKSVSMQKRTSPLKFGHDLGRGALSLAMCAPFATKVTKGRGGEGGGGEGRGGESRGLS